MTVAQIVLNLLPHLPSSEQGRALTQGLAFLGRDTQGHRPRFPVAPLEGEAEPAQLARWYRRFVDNRLGQSAERVAATGSRIDPTATEQFMFAACTDHVFIDDGHVIDYLNKACEAAAAIGDDGWALLLPTVVRATASATRHEEVSEWREPVDLIPIIDETASRITETRGPGMPDDELGAVGWALLVDDPHDVANALVDAATRGASMEQLARAVAFAAALRLVRFHIQNDVGDWDTVHHTFTTANAVHQAIGRHPTPELARGIVHGALRVYLDRFLNVPAARLPADEPRRLEEMEQCWESRGGVDRGRPDRRRTPRRRRQRRSRPRRTLPSALPRGRRLPLVPVHRRSCRPTPCLAGRLTRSRPRTHRRSAVAGRPHADRAGDRSGRHHHPQAPPRRTRLPGPVAPTTRRRSAVDATERSDGSIRQLAAGLRPENDAMPTPGSAIGVPWRRGVVPRG